ncbi:hypothetical protein TetV_600 [Tetraselmis virus 1]|uniref:Uncharacterized protein n=1 Tax=Tetraselmis virus 1 TaxID=2060617 RepID=A0A2P0VP88_9VIRU|nr:hypothetical protein QJ968_gp454 [Tetraselmis virus 1]AUF82682.1 hypothetical protein TetV_600 [Tetraselmis virus 1]
MASGGWTFKAAVSNTDLLTDTLTGDAIFRTDGRDARFVFGCSNATASVLQIDKDGINVPGNCVAATYLCGSEILTTNNDLLDATKLDGFIRDSNVPDEFITAVMIADSNITPDKLTDTIPVSLGGIGASSLVQDEILIGNGTGPVYSSTNLSWNDSTDTFSVLNTDVTGVLSLPSIPNVEDYLNNVSSSVGNINSNQILDSNVLSRHVAESNLLSIHYSDDSILNQHLSVDSVTSLKIAESNIISTHYVDNSILAKHLASDSVTTDKILDDAVTSDKIGGTLSVSVGGTGVSTFTQDQIVIGNSTDPLYSSSSLAWNNGTSTLSVANVNVTGVLELPSISDVEDYLNNISDIVANINSNQILDSNVLARHVAESNIDSIHYSDLSVLEQHLAANSVTTDKIADSTIPPGKLSGTIGVALGGTGNSSLTQDQILIGNGTDPVYGSTNLSWNNSTDTFSVQNTDINGVLSLPTIPNVEDYLNNVSSSVGNINSNQILDSNVLSRHIADDTILLQHMTDDSVGTSELVDLSVTEGKLALNSVTTDKISDSNVTLSKINAVIPTAFGGTGVTDLTTGHILFGPQVSGDPLASSASLLYDIGTENLTSTNMFAERMHGSSNIVVGQPGTTRYRFFISNDDNLSISQIDSGDNETGYVNFGDLIALLSNVNVVSE